MLQMVIRTSTSQTTSTPQISQEMDSSDNLMNFKLSVDRISFLSTFTKDIIKENTTIGKALFSLDINNNLLITVPSFWLQVEIDPTYCVLLDPQQSKDTSCTTSCSNTGTTYKVIGGVIGAILGVALLVIVGLWLYKRQENKKAQKKFALASGIS